MRQRYTYSLLIGIPGIALAVFVAIPASGAVAGLFWLYVFGDNEWPSWTKWAALVIGGIVFIAALTVIIRIGYSVGKKREIQNIPTSGKHVLLSVITVVLLVLLMIVFQRGYFLKKPNHQLCYDLCVQKGYDGTGTNLGPQVDGKSTCGCWNGEANAFDEVGTVE